MKPLTKKAKLLSWKNSYTTKNLIAIWDSKEDGGLPPLSFYVPTFQTSLASAKGVTFEIAMRKNDMAFDTRSIIYDGSSYGESGFAIIYQPQWSRSSIGWSNNNFCGGLVSNPAWGQSGVFISLSVTSSTLGSHLVVNGEDTPRNALVDLPAADSTTLRTFSYYNNEIFSIRIYDRALSATEISANYAIDKMSFRLT